MINREWKQVVVSAFTTVTDSYGQLHKGTPTTRTIRMVLKPTSINNVNDVRFIDVNCLGLTEDKSIIAGNEITDGTDKYLVMTVMPSSRYTQVFLKQCR